MARIKNATFSGAVPRSVVADASIRRDWLANAVGDTALVSDKITGENSETPITHTGAGDGCPLRLPLAAQHLDRSLIVYGVGPTPGEADFYVIAVPIFVGAGDANIFRLDADMRTPAGVDVTLEVLDSTGANVWGPYPGTARGTDDDLPGASNVSESQRFRWDFEVAAAGVFYLLVKRPCFFIDNDPDGRLVSWTLDHVRPTVGEANGISAGNGGAAVSDPYPAAFSFTPSTDHDTYDEEVTVDGPLSAYVLTRLNRQLNTLWEYITGAVIPGNATHQCVTAVNNNRSSFTSEGLLDFPMTVVALGACHGDTGKPAVDDYTDSTPSNGPIGHLMHPLSRSTTNDNIASLAMECPSFRTSTSDLKCVVLVHSPGGAATAANWRFRVQSSAGTSSAVSLVQVGTSNFLVATITGVPFTASSENYLNVQIANTATGALGTETLDILGACLFYEP